MQMTQTDDIRLFSITVIEHDHPIMTYQVAVNPKSKRMGIMALVNHKKQQTAIINLVTYDKMSTDQKVIYDDCKKTGHNDELSQFIACRSPYYTYQLSDKFHMHIMDSIIHRAFDPNKTTTDCLLTRQTLHIEKNKVHTDLSGIKFVDFTNKIDKLQQSSPDDELYDEESSS
jgi:hypothetical protein